MKKILVTLVLFILYVSIHYLEGFSGMGESAVTQFSVGGMSIAQVWKLPLLAVLMLFFVLTTGKSKGFEMWTIILAIETLFSVETFENPVFAIVSAVKLLPFVLFFHLLFNTTSYTTIEVILLNLSRFICFTSFLTLLDIITPVEDYILTTSFGFEDQSYYSSLFGAPHAASSYFAIAIVVLLYFQKNKKYSSIWWMYLNYCLIAVGFISIFKAYVRTGWIMLLAGVVILYGKQMLTSWKYIIASIILVVGLSYFYDNNEVFRARISGRNVYTNVDASGVDINGSGRLEFWKNGFSLWEEGNVYEMFFGQGYTAVTENNERLTGLKVFSHNQFIDMLSQHGLLGLIFLLIIFVSQYRYISQRRGHEYHVLCLTCYFMTIIFNFFQNELYFDYAVIYASIFALLSKDTPYDVSESEENATQKEEVFV